MTLRVLQLNLHKSRLASAELLIALEQGPVDIALVQESWIASGNTVAGLSSDVLTAVMLESEEQRLLVASCYMAHDRSAPPDELSSLVELGSRMTNSSLVQMPMHTTACGEAQTSTVAVYRNLRNTNWEKFTRTVTSKLVTSPGIVKFERHIERSLETLSKEILDAYHASCPTSRTRKKTRPPWWNRELILQRLNLREFFKIAKKVDDEIIDEEYKILLRDYKKESRRALRSSWRNF
ncbi:uncharacterized protein [Drosophila takahashii]|uniref:uncharacterized protein n=1 Tax=Drosophila takahashii TaxID=29030 RepID=UPI003898F161